MSEQVQQQETPTTTINNNNILLNNKLPNKSKTEKWDRHQIENYILNYLTIPEKNFNLKPPAYYRKKEGVKDPIVVKDKSNLINFLNDNNNTKGNNNLDEEYLPNDTSMVEEVPREVSSDYFQEEFKKPLTDDQMKNFNMFKMFYKLASTKCFSYASLAGASIAAPVALFVSFRYRGLGKERFSALIEKTSYSFFIPFFIVYPICKWQKVKKDEKLREAVKGRNY
ncbi:hypothetical protein ABK040_002124 [Willaertia magna]